MKRRMRYAALFLAGAIQFSSMLGGANIAFSENLTGAAESGTSESRTGVVSAASPSDSASANLSGLQPDSDSTAIGDLINSQYAVVYDLDRGRIIADKNSSEVINPASMTKVMTLLVCAEHLPDLDKRLTVTQDIVDYVHAHDASNCGLEAGEQISVRDLLYGVILPSGADAVMLLSREIAGSEAAFVGLMNQKAQELGLSSGAHFSNATGLYDPNHHMTVKDTAEILNAAMKNPTARTVLESFEYSIPATNKHAAGIRLSNLFLKRIKGQDTGRVSVTAAKTGYVRQSMFCAVSSGVSESGKHYLVVSGFASSTWQCIADQAALYRSYCR